MRECHRLVSLVSQRGNADCLELPELLAMAEWVAAPAREAEAVAWSRDVAVPLVRELGRRLQRHCDSVEVGVPELLQLMRDVRAAQKAYWQRRRQPKEISQPLLKAALVLEKRMDAVVANHLQPSLFGDGAEVKAVCTTQRDS